MKKLLTILSISLLFISVQAQPPGQWMWIHGPNISGGNGNFGTIGVAAPTNDPPALYHPCSWTDLNGNLWLFGGYGPTGRYAALWKFDPTTNMWTWVKGPSAANAVGVYGTLGVPAIGNYPPSRSHGICTFVDAAGDLWLFGGDGGGYFSDLWRYNIASNMWTWMKGPNTLSAPGVYGTQGVPAMANYPPSRSETSASWSDNAGNLWIFGGNSHNDLWRYNIASNMWTWMKGSNLTGQAGVYGTQTVEAPGNTPGARMAYSTFKDASGNLWLFGGGDYGTNLYWNDLWRYNVSTNNWAWMKGSNVAMAVGVYGTRCTPAAANTPGARFEHRANVAWTTGSDCFYMWGGAQGGGLNPAWNDFWRYSVATNQWTWLAGSNTQNPVANYGTMNVPSPTNSPDGRGGAAVWLDNSGHLYFYGGYYVGFMGDMWRYTIDPACGPGSCTQSIAVNTTSVNILCNGQCTGSATATPVGGSTPFTYSWSNGGNTQTIGSLCAGNYSVTVTDAVGLSATSTVTVTEPPALSVSSVSPAAVCPGGCASVSASGSGGTPGYNYSWTPSIGSGAGPFTVCPPSTTVYTVEVTDANGCTNSATSTVTINTPPPAVITPAGPVPICTGTATLHANTGAGYTYQWYFNGSPVGSGLDSLVISATGSYSVVVTDGNGCSSTSTPVNAVQGVGPVITLSTSGGQCNAGVILIGWPGSPVVITATAPGAVTYLWSPGGQTTSSITPTAGGTYSVMAWDANGCPSGGNDTITIVAVNVTCGHNGNKVILCHVPPGNPGNPQTICVDASAIPSHLANHPGDCVGPCSLYYAPRVNPGTDPIVGDIEQAFYIDAYPNPFNGTFSVMIHSSMDSPVNVKIYDMTGRVVESYVEINEKTAIGGNLKAGVYTIEAEQQGITQRQRIVKE